MKPRDTLRFALSDRIDDAPVGPSHVPLALLGEFQKDVTEFLKGSGKEVDPSQTIVSIEEGSLALVANGLLAAAGLWADVAQLQNPATLGLIDPKRAAVVERWQKAARKNPHRRYLLADEGNAVTVLIDSQTEFRSQIEAAWVPVEKYLTGLVTDLGGTTKANVHLKLADGLTLTIVADQQLLANEERNRLYKPATLLVRAEESLKSGELRNLSLVAFQPENSGWDEAAFAKLVRKGTQAWKDVPDDWLEELRSNQG
jgi:hypothetical protein